MGLYRQSGSLCDSLSLTQSAKSSPSAEKSGANFVVASCPFFMMSDMPSDSKALVPYFPILPISAPLPVTGRKNMQNVAPRWTEPCTCSPTIRLKAVSDLGGANQSQQSTSKTAAHTCRRLYPSSHKRSCRPSVTFANLDG